MVCRDLARLQTVWSRVLSVLCPYTEDIPSAPLTDSLSPSDASFDDDEESKTSWLSFSFMSVDTDVERMRESKECEAISWTKGGWHCKECNTKEDGKERLASDKRVCA
jgi:hypothetical protein